MKTISMIFAILIALASSVAATLIYVELPNDISLDAINKPGLEVTKEINNTVAYAIQRWNGNTNAQSRECFSVIMTRDGKPILPNTQGLIKPTTTNGNIQFVRGEGWSDPEWEDVNHHINGDEAAGLAGAYRWLIEFYGYPLFSNNVRVNYTMDIPNMNYYNISTKDIFFYYDTTEFPWYQNFILNRLMLHAFRDEAYIDWDHFEAGMNACISTLTQDKLDGDAHSILENQCLKAWHGGPLLINNSLSAFNNQMAAIYYQICNGKAIATNCKNFVGRSEYQPGSGGNLDYERLNMCSMFWYKIYNQKHAFFKDFNDNLLNHYVRDITNDHYYTPPDYATMISWLYELAPSSIENIDKNIWINNQWIMRTNMTSNTYNLFLKSYGYLVPPHTDENSAMCYFYYRGDSHNTPYEMPLTNEPIEIVYSDTSAVHKDQVFYTSSEQYEEGWVILSIGSAGFIPVPSSTPERYILEATSVNTGKSNHMEDMLFSGRNDQEIFGCIQLNDDGQVIITNLGTSEQWTLPVVNGCFRMPNLGSWTTPNDGAGSYRADFYRNGVLINTRYFTKDGGNYELFIGENYPQAKTVKTKTLQFYLRPPAPNPLTHNTTLNLSLSQPGHARLLIFDISGRLVKVLLDGEYNAGAQTLSWDATDSVGKPIANGVYTVLLSSQIGNLSKRIVVAR